MAIIELRARMLQHRLHNLLGRGNALTSPLSMTFAINNAERRGLCETSRPT
jgi:hypothetical protein